MKSILTIICMCISLNSFAAGQCTPEDKRNLTIAAAAIGVTAGVAVAGTLVAITPVGAVGGPMAITYFTGVGSAALGTWVTSTVIPVVGGTAVMSGSLFALAANLGYDEACAKAVERQARAIGKHLEGKY